MNQDIFAGQWKQMRGTLKSWWGKLADDDFERIGGQKDKLIGLVQEKYGQTREQAQQEVERRMKEYGDTMGDHSGNGMPERAEAGAGMTAKAQELGATAMNTASEAATAVGEQMGSLAGSDSGPCAARRGDSHRGDHRSGRVGIGEHVPERERLRESGHRPHRLGAQLPCASVIGGGGLGVFAGPQHEGVSHGE